MEQPIMQNELIPEIVEEVKSLDAIIKPQLSEELHSSEGELVGEECMEEQITCFKC